MIKKGIVVGVILLFFGVAVSPGSTSILIDQEPGEDEHVEYSTELCGFPGMKPQTVRLTQQQANEVELLFDNITTRLGKTTSPKEAVEIVNETIIQLATYGLLPNKINTKQLQTFLANTFTQHQEVTIFEKFSNNQSIQELHHTFCCLVTGVIHDGYAMGIVFMIGVILMLLSVFPSPFHILLGNPFILILGGLLSLLSFGFVTISPFALMQQVNILSGNMTSIGIKGITKFNQGLLNGFNGIKITRIAAKKIYLLGFSFMVSYEDIHI